MEDVFKERIGFKGDIILISKKICEEYDLGDYISSKIILIGYEDFNMILETSLNKYFVKIFAHFRNNKDRQRYIEIMQESIKANISTPKLLKSEQGFMSEISIENTKLFLCVMDFIDGSNLYETKEEISESDIRFLSRQTSLINSIDLKPDFVYDSWAIINFRKEFEKKSKFLSSDDLILIQPLVEEFENLNIDKLPHCFAHGDIINTNVMKDSNSNLFIIDFSVSNHYPRVQELSVLACNLFFDPNSLEISKNNLKIALDEYQKNIKLTDNELHVLPLYIKLAHAMHLLSANYEKIVENNDSDENEYWMNLGRTGLKQMLN
jgi:Ser/Thr protein kinase RdoA (MazF antagonist)